MRVKLKCKGLVGQWEPQGSLCALKEAKSELQSLPRAVAPTRPCLILLSPVCEMDLILRQISSGRKAGGHYDRSEKCSCSSLPVVSQTLTHHRPPLPLPGWIYPAHTLTLSVLLFCPGQKHWLAIKTPAGWKTSIAYLRNTCSLCHATSSE